MAIVVGARVHELTIDPDWDDGPQREGDIEVHWPERDFKGQKFAEAAMRVALAGPAAEMVYTGDPFHPALIEQWSGDWRTALQQAASLANGEAQQWRLLETTTRQLYEYFSRDDVWQAVASIADELLAHDRLDGSEVAEIVARWL